MSDQEKADATAHDSTQLRTSWRAVAIVLGIVLGAVLICAAVVVADLTGLALSLM